MNAKTIGKFIGEFQPCTEARLYLRANKKLSAEKLFRKAKGGFRGWLAAQLDMKCEPGCLYCSGKPLGTWKKVAAALRKRGIMVR